MKKSLPFIVILLVISYALYNAKFRSPKKVETPSNTNYTQHIKEHHDIHYKEELSTLNTNKYIKEYIIKVINHGSSELKYKKDEIMEAGFSSKEDAYKIACYTLELSGKKCKEPYEKDAAMFYTSICGGCHGDDGKGLGGTYPDLTKDKLLGIATREEFLKTMIDKMR